MFVTLIEDLFNKNNELINASNQDRSLTETSNGK